MQKLLTVIAILLCSFSLAAQNRYQEISAPSKQEFLKKNTGIDSIQQNDSSITVFLNSGVKESYMLGIAAERQRFIANYGTPPNYNSNKNARVSRRKKE